MCTVNIMENVVLYDFLKVIIHRKFSSSLIDSIETL